MYVVAGFNDARRFMKLLAISISTHLPASVIYLRLALSIYQTKPKQIKPD